MNERDFFFRFGKLNISNKKQYEYLVGLRARAKDTTYTQATGTTRDILDVFPGSTLI